MTAAAPSRYRIVADTNLIIGAGSTWVMSQPPVPDPTKSLQRVIHCIAESHTGLYCGEIVGEYIEKLIDLGHPTERVTRYIAYLLGAFERVKVVSKTCAPAPTDADDVIFLLCAIDGRADYLFSADRAVLAVRTAYDPPKIRDHAECGAVLGL
jgi:predicted nucleic acid-binding protein